MNNDVLVKSGCVLHDYKTDHLEGEEIICYVSFEHAEVLVLLKTVPLTLYQQVRPCRETQNTDDIQGDRM